MSPDTGTASASRRRGSRQPDAAVTRRARRRALWPPSRRRRRGGAALAAPLLARVVRSASRSARPSSRAAARPATTPGIRLPAATGLERRAERGMPSRRSPSRRSANVRLSPDDDPGRAPVRDAALAAAARRRHRRVLDRPPRGVPGARQLHLPLRLRDAIRPVRRPDPAGRPLGQYELRGTVNGQEVVVTVYFGSARPADGVLAATQRQLDRLVVVSQPAATDVAERALPLRSPGGGSARVIDRTLSARRSRAAACARSRSRLHGLPPGRGVADPAVRRRRERRRAGHHRRPRRLARLGRGGQVRPQREPDAERGRRRARTRRASARGPSTAGSAASPRRRCRCRRRGSARPPDPLGITFDCATPAPCARPRPRRRARRADPLPRAAVREDEGVAAGRRHRRADDGRKQLAFASVSDSGRSRSPSRRPVGRTN